MCKVGYHYYSRSRPLPIKYFPLEAGIFSGIPRDGKQNRYESRVWDGRGKYLMNIMAHEYHGMNIFIHANTHVFYFYFLDISLSIDIFFKDGVSKFLAQVHMRPKAHPVCLKAQRFVVILSAHK